MSYSDKKLSKLDQDMWFSRGMDDAKVENPSLYPRTEEPLGAHLAYIAGRKYAIGEYVIDEPRTDFSDGSDDVESNSARERAELRYQKAADNDTLDLY